MTYEALRLAIDALGLLGLALSLVAGLYAWRVGRRQMAREELDEKVRRVHDRIDRHKDTEAALRDRVSRVEQAASAAPTGKAVHELALSITTFGGELKAVTAQLSGLKEVVGRQERVTTRLEDYVRAMEKKGSP